MNIEAKVLKVLANQIQQHIKSIINIIKWGLYVGFKDGSISINQ